MTTAIIESLRDEENVPQYGLGMILFMYAWPVAWFMFLIYVIGPLFVRSDGTYPLWGYNLIGVLGNGAELIAALLIFRREGYRLTPKALRSRTLLRARINLRFPNKLWKWAACVGALSTPTRAGRKTVPIACRRPPSVPLQPMEAGPHRIPQDQRPADWLLICDKVHLDL